MKLRCACGWIGDRSECVERKQKMPRGINGARYCNTITTYHGCPKCSRIAKVYDEGIKLGLDGNKTFWPSMTMKATSNNSEETTKPIEINLGGAINETLIVKMHEDRPSACKRCVFAVNGDSTRTCPNIVRGKSHTLLCTAFGVGSYFIKKE